MNKLQLFVFQVNYAAYDNNLLLALRENLSVPV
jgi:hypothetical protein